MYILQEEWKTYTFLHRKNFKLIKEGFGPKPPPLDWLEEKNMQKGVDFKIFRHSYFPELIPGDVLV